MFIPRRLIIGKPRNLKQFDFSIPFLAHDLKQQQSSARFDYRQRSDSVQLPNLTSLKLQLFQLKMGNGQFQVPKHVNNEWTEIYKSNKKQLKNKITHQEFQFMMLPKTPEYQDISQLIERSIYSIPKTPKIIILNVEKGELFILVQEYNLPLAQHLGKIILTIDILELLLETLTVFSCLFKKYGEFGISEKMIGLNQNMEIMAWINENKQKNQIQIQLQKSEEPQKIMISQIIAIFRKYFKGFLPIEEFSSANNMDVLQMKLIKMIKKRKIEISANFTELKSNRNYIKRNLSPQKSFLSMRHEEAKSPKAVDSSMKMEKKNNIPNFLKRMAQKKINFLDNLQEKRPSNIDKPKQILTKQRNLMKIKSLKSQKSLSKSSNKGQSLKVSPTKFTNINCSGEISKLSFPTSIFTEKTCDFLNQSGSPSSYIIKKRDFLQSRKAKANKDWKFQSLTPKTAKNNYQSPSPTYTQNQSNYWANTDCFLCPLLPNYQSNIHQEQVETNSKVPLLQKRSNTTMQEISGQHKKQCIVKDQKWQNRVNLKILEDEFNQFFSDHSQSPRFMFEDLPQSLELKQQFSKIIDF